MKYFITGTHAYGPVTEDSDLDIVMLKDDAEQIRSFIQKHHIATYQTEKQEAYDNGGFYFDLLGIKINIIIAIDEADFAEWKEKTERMKEFEPIKDRQQRIDFFNENNTSTDSISFNDTDDIPF